MSTGTLKKPSRPPPPVPVPQRDSYSSSTTNSTHYPSNSSSSSSSATFASYKKSGKSDYIKISECHTGLPDKNQQLGGVGSFDDRFSNGLGSSSFKNRTSTSFSSATLKPSTNLFSPGTSSPSTNHNHPAFGQTFPTNHQKSRSLTENHLNPSSYDLPPYEAQHNSRGNRNHSSTRYSSNTSAISSGNSHNRSFACGRSYFRQQQVDNREASSSKLPALDYRQVDFLATAALTKCKVERTSGRGSDFNRLLVSSNQRKS